jgi:hypothetical protein
MTNIIESKHDKFRRLASNRGNRVLHLLELIGNLSNQANYEYTQEEARKLFNAIERQLKTAKQQFFSKEAREEREIFFL